MPILIYFLSITGKKYLDVPRASTHITTLMKTFGSKNNVSTANKSKLPEQANMSERKLSCSSINIFIRTKLLVNYR